MKKKRKAVKISIPEPCHEDWAKMTPKEKGRHCAVCEKVVVDFSKFTNKEIYHYLNENKGAKTCGRFGSNQLDKPIYEKEIRANNWSVFKYAASLFVGLSTVLSSKAQAPLDSVQVTEKEKENDKANRQVIVTGQVLNEGAPIPNASITLPDSSIVKADSAGYYSFEYNGVLNTLPITVEGEELKFETTIEIGHLAQNHSSILNHDIENKVKPEVPKENVKTELTLDDFPTITFISGSIAAIHTLGITFVDDSPICDINEIQEFRPINYNDSLNKRTADAKVKRFFGPRSLLKELRKINNLFPKRSITMAVLNSKTKDAPEQPEKQDQKPRIEAVLTNPGFDQSKKKGAKS